MLSFFSKRPHRPNAQTVTKRALILREIFVKGAATPPPDALAEWMTRWTEDERREFFANAELQNAPRVGWLQRTGLWAEMSNEEQAFMNTGVVKVTTEQIVNASWLAESIGCLLWALGHFPETPAYDEETSHEPIKAMSNKSIQVHLKTASLRPANEIDIKRDLAELWHWRCRTRTLLESRKIPSELENGMSMDEVIELSATKAAESHAFETTIGNDFPTFGKPFREMTVEEFAHVTSTSQERHKAFNWLCGYAPGNRWDETPTDT